VWVPRCTAALPLDAGEAFAGPRFLVWDDRVALFEPDPAAGPGDLRTSWRLRSLERLPAAPPATGLGRARVKWRDGALWMKAGTGVYQRDAASGQWFRMADPGLEFRDFDVDPRGRILLVATADPATRSYRALLEEVDADRHGTEVLQRYPERDRREGFRRLPPVAAATLLTGYEATQVGEYVVLCNPLARRVYVYRTLDGGFREADLGLPPRSLEDLAAGPERTSTGDLCWQVLPKGPHEAWIVLPARVVPSGAMPRKEGPDDGLAAISLDLLEARGEAPVALPGLRPPVFPDARGRLADLAGAVASYREAGSRPVTPAGADPAPEEAAPPR
jgi:hypothetical protein